MLTAPRCSIMTPLGGRWSRRCRSRRPGRPGHAWAAGGGAAENGASVLVVDHQACHAFGPGPVRRPAGLGERQAVRMYRSSMPPRPVRIGPPIALTVPRLASIPSGDGRPNARAICPSPAGLFVTSATVAAARSSLQYRQIRTRIAARRPSPRLRLRPRESL